MLARLAAALQRGQLQGVNGAQLGAALGGAGVVLNNEDCSVSVPLERTANAFCSDAETDVSSGDVSDRPQHHVWSQRCIHRVRTLCFIGFRCRQ
jgi:hypothetical protein